MKKLIFLLMIGSVALMNCSGDNSSETNSDMDEMEQISSDAQKTADELEKETEELENSVDSLLSDI